MINLVSEHTIEHRMLALLEQNARLQRAWTEKAGVRWPCPRGAPRSGADRKPDDPPEIRAQRPAVDPFDQLRDEVVGEWSDHLDLVELHGEAAQRRRFFSVEALVPMHEAVEAALKALCLWRGHNTGTPPALGLIDSVLVQTNLLR